MTPVMQLSLLENRYSTDPQAIRLYIATTRNIARRGLCVDLILASVLSQAVKKIEMRPFILPV